jgi:dihydrofolate reductase
MRKLIVGFAVSLDGYIEGPNGEYDWIIYDKEQYKVLAKHWKKIDALFYGRKTYEAVLKMKDASKGKNNPFAHMKHYVFSNSLTKVKKGFILISGDTSREVIKIKKKPGKDIAVFGGSELACSLINLKLVDELMLAICPVLLSKGKPFFSNINERNYFTLKESKTYSSGLVSLTYEAMNNK